MRRPQFTLRSLLVAMITAAIMCLVIFPLWVGYAVRSVEREIESEEDRRWRERFTPPPGWECPPGFHIGEDGQVVSDNDDGRGK